MAKDFQKKPDDFNFLNVNEYLDLIIEFLINLNPKIVIQRFIAEAPNHLLIAPKWNGIKNFEFANAVDIKLKALTMFQGSKFT